MTKSSVLLSVANCMKDILPIQTLDGQQTPPGICEPQMSVSRYLEVNLFQQWIFEKNIVIFYNYFDISVFYAADREW